MHSVSTGNKHRADDVSDSLLMDIPEYPEPVEDDDSDKSDSDSDASINSVIHLPDILENESMYLGDLPKSRRRQRQLRRSNSDYQVTVIDKGKTTTIHSPFRRLQVDTSSVNDAETYDDDDVMSTVTAPELVSILQPTSSRSKPRSNRHSVSFSVQSDQNRRKVRSIDVLDSYSNCSFDVNPVDYKRRHRRDRHSRIKVPPKPHSTSLIDESLLYGDIFKNRPPRVNRQYSKTKGIDEVHSRSSSSTDSFSEIERNIYASFTRETSMRNAAMRNTFERPRSHSTRVRRRQHARSATDHRSEASQETYSTRRSVGTGASGHNLNTSISTEPAQFFDDGASEVGSVRSAFTDLDAARRSYVEHFFQKTPFHEVGAGTSFSSAASDIGPSTHVSSGSGKHHFIRRADPGNTTASHHTTVQHAHTGQLKLSIYVNYGLLTVHVGQAKRLSSKLNPSCNSFVQILIEPDPSDRTLCRTSMVGDSNCPVYDEKFSFELMDEDHCKRVYISVYNIDFDTGSKECLGSMSFSLKHILAVPEKIRGWFYLLPESRGHKHCMPAKDKRHPLQERPLPPIPVQPPLNACLKPDQNMIWMDTHVLTIQKGRYGYGFVVSGSSPVQVSQVHPDCPAIKAGLKKDDYVTHINGLNVSRSTADNVARIIGGIHGTICVEIQRPRTMGSVDMSMVNPGDKTINKGSKQNQSLLITGERKKSQKKFHFKLPSLPGKRDGKSKLNKTMGGGSSNDPSQHNTTSIHSKLNKSLNFSSFLPKIQKKSSSVAKLNRTAIEAHDLNMTTMLDPLNGHGGLNKTHCAGVPDIGSADALDSTTLNVTIHRASSDGSLNLSSSAATASSSRSRTLKNLRSSLPWRRKKKTNEENSKAV